MGIIHQKSILAMKVKVKICIYVSAMRVFRWFIARVGDFAGGAQLRPYRPSSQGFMHHNDVCCER